MPCLQRVAGGLTAAIAALLAWTATAAAQQPTDLPETPVEYEAYALKQEPELKAIYAQWQAARSEAKAAASNWPQPRVGYQAFIDGWWLEGNSVTHVATVSQRFPWPGVLDEAADPAEKRAEALRHQFQARVLEIVFEVRSLVIDIARLDEERAILKEQVAVYEDVRSLVERNMAADEADYGDLLRVSTAREQLVDQLDVLESRREQRVADLRELLTVGPEVDLTFDFEGEADPLDVPEGVPDREALAEAARRQHPALAARRARADALLERAEYARKKQLPSPTVSLGVRSMPDYMQISGYDRRTALILGVSFPIPIFGAQYDHEYEQFANEQDAQLADRVQTRSELVSGIDAAVTRIAEKRRRLERYRQELLPLAGDATEQMLQQIETGERSVTDYLLSFEQELDLETNVVEFRAAVARSRARIEQLTGGAFDAYPDREVPEIEIDEAGDTETDDE